MKNTPFVAEITGPSYDQKIVGPGYFIIMNPGSKHVSFSKGNHDVCFGDTVSDIIPEYTNEQYIEDYGHRVISTGQTLREYAKSNLRMAV